MSRVSHGRCLSTTGGMFLQLVVVFVRPVRSVTLPPKMFVWDKESYLVLFTSAILVTLHAV